MRSALLHAAIASLALAAAPHAIAGNRCAFGAFVQEDDPAGLNLRDAPSLQARILGTLPPTFTPPGDPGLHVRIAVDVLGDDSGWFHVARARDDEALTGRAPRPLPARDGWVSGRKLTVKSQATQGRAAPDAAAPVVLALGEGESLDSDAIVAASHLVACRGRWALVELDAERLPQDVRAQLKVSPGGPAGATATHPRAWVDQVCGVQETTCDGADAK